MTLTDHGRVDEDQRRPLSPDARRLVAAQALRAFAYGFGALLLGTTLRRRGLSPGQAGLVLSAVIAGTIAVSLAVARWSDRLGRRCYATLYALLGAAGAVFALSDRGALLVLVALTGVLSTGIVDNGPFTSLEQAMLATDLAGPGLRALSQGGLAADADDYRLLEQASSTTPCMPSRPGTWPGSPRDPPRLQRHQERDCDPGGEADGGGHHGAEVRRPTGGRCHRLGRCASTSSAWSQEGSLRQVRRRTRWAYSRSARKVRVDSGRVMVPG